MRQTRLLLLREPARCGLLGRSLLGGRVARFGRAPPFSMIASRRLPKQLVCTLWRHRLERSPFDSDALVRHRHVTPNCRPWRRPALPLAGSCRNSRSGPLGRMFVAHATEHLGLREDLEGLIEVMVSNCSRW